MPKCPHCNGVIDVHLVKAPPMQSQQAAKTASDDVGELLASISDETLDDMAFKFVTETRERYEQYGSHTRLSERQLNWLKKLAEVPF